MPPAAYRYTVPTAWYQDYAVRKYGFHGTSHRWVAERGAEQLDMVDAEHGLITAHLGEWLLDYCCAQRRQYRHHDGPDAAGWHRHGTRSGSIDPGILTHVAAQSGQSLDEVTNDLNKRSGLLGLSGSSNDMRTLAEASAAGDAAPVWPLTSFVIALAQEIMSMAASLPRLDALVFTGGIGENAAAIRPASSTTSACLALSMAEEANAAHGRDDKPVISTNDSRAAIIVINTNEELQIARETAALL